MTKRHAPYWYYEGRGNAVEKEKKNDFNLETNSNLFKRP